MPIDSRNSEKIASLQPEFRNKLYDWLNDCGAEKIEPFIVEGLRSYVRQRQLYAKGRTAKGPIITMARPGLGGRLANLQGQSALRG